MHSLFVIDLIWTSLHQQHPMPEIDELIKDTVNDFSYFARKLNPTDLRIFNRFRTMMMSHSEFFDEFEDFFIEFYNCGVFFVQYADDHCTVMKAQADFPKDFNQYLDEILSWKPSIRNSRLQKTFPKENDSPVNIFENYLGYKLLNLMFFKEDLMKADFKIQQYENFEDKNIEKLLFENQHIIPFILSVQNKYLHGKGLNFGAFSNLVIEKGFFEELAQKHPEFNFSRRINFSVI